MTNGVSGLQKVGELVDTFPGKKEKDSSSDSTLSSYSGNLDSEITACDTKITNLESEISRLESQYQTALDEEREAAKKALDDIKNFLS